MEQEDRLTPSAAQPTVAVTYAGFWWRFLAWLIDNILLWTVIGIIITPLIFVPFLRTMGLELGQSPEVPLNPEENFGLFNQLLQIISIQTGISVLLTWIYYVVLTVVYGGTVGKLVLKMRVVDENQQKIGWGRAILREVIGKLVSTIVLSLGYLWVAWDPKKQSWHDKIAGTYVIKVK